MRIQNEEVGLNVVVDGPDDAPPILLLHGILGSARTWDWIVPRLEDRYRVLRLDFRGHGASDRTPGEYGSSGYVSDAIAVCEQAIGRPCIVMGHSLGGVTAAIVMQQRPELIRAAILEDPPLGVPSGANRNVGDDHALFAAFGLMRQSIPALQVAGMSAKAVAEFSSSELVLNENSRFNIVRTKVTDI